eukprot:scaffold236402_cov33-Tisochrysis_lutea.AAC.2
MRTARGTRGGSIDRCTTLKWGRLLRICNASPRALPIYRPGAGGSAIKATIHRQPPFPQRGATDCASARNYKPKGPPPPSPTLDPN